tara:strand:+ start:655 stop:1716 length:1062 start_codon:yes stop_codon:yes gene_type:complete
MSFFNRKEEVIDLQLTPHGKYLLSQGKLRPEYYAFFDDDILYDREFGGPSEAQNDISDRIKTTPRTRTQYNFRGLETEITKNIKDIRANNLSDFSEVRTRAAYAVKHVVDAAPIGTAEIGKQKAPAWRLSFLKGEISGSERMYVPNYSLEKYTPPLNVPQVDAVITYKTGIRQQSSRLDEEPSPGDEEIYGSSGYSFEDGTEIFIKDAQFLVIELIEENSAFLSSNFDIEVFQIEEIRDKNGNKTGQENLAPLYFHKDPEPLFYVDKNNILIDDTRNRRAQNPLSLDNQTADMVEYFLQIDVDREIDEEIMCRLDPPDRTRGIYARRFYECDSISNERENIYTTEEYEDDCVT